MKTNQKTAKYSDISEKSALFSLWTAVFIQTLIIGAMVIFVVFYSKQQRIKSDMRVPQSLDEVVQRIKGTLKSTETLEVTFSKNPVLAACITSSGRLCPRGLPHSLRIVDEQRSTDASPVFLTGSRFSPVYYSESGKDCQETLEQCTKEKYPIEAISGYIVIDRSLFVSFCVRRREGVRLKSVRSGARSAQCSLLGSVDAARNIAPAELEKPLALLIAEN